MSQSRKEERSVLKSAGTATPDCLSDKELMIVFEANRRDERLLGHVSECARCQSALALIQDFRSADATDAEREDVDWIVQRLREDLAPTAQTASNREVDARNGRTRNAEGWLGKLFRANPFAMTAWAGATVAIAVAGGLWLQQALRPDLALGPDAAPLILRSASIEPISPSGDVSSFPDSFAWSPIDGAAKYKVEIMEVDRSVVWQEEVRSATIPAPDRVRAIAVPGKTLLWRVSAVDAAGNAIAVSEVERFRIAVPSSEYATSTEEA